jgi:hypothetical protein
MIPNFPYLTLCVYDIIITFREIVIVASCANWNHKNSIIFDGLSLSLSLSLSLNSWKYAFVSDLRKVTLRAKPSMH